MEICEWKDSMTIHVEFAYASGDGGKLSERLGFDGKYMDVEASSAREVFVFLRSQSPIAQDLFQLNFSRVGLLDGSWVVILNRGSKNAKAIKSDADLDTLLDDGDRIYITSAA